MMAITPAFEKERQEDLEFKASWGSRRYSLNKQNKARRRILWEMPFKTRYKIEVRCATVSSEIDTLNPAGKRLLFK